MITYYPTILENYIETIYSQINISQPHELDIQEIAERLNIPTYFFSTGSQAIFVFGGPKLNINPDISPPEQWEDFGHELCHALRQYGSQLNMPSEYITFQEEKADNFALQFCIPTFMLEKLELPQYRTEAIGFISETFNVTFKFAQRRLEKHEQQLLGSQYTVQIRSRYEATQNFKKDIGYDYTLEDNKKTYLMSRNNGLVGIVNNWRSE